MLSGSPQRSARGFARMRHGPGIGPVRPGKSLLFQRCITYSLFSPAGGPAVKKGTWTADWAVALVICLVFGAAVWKPPVFLDGLERAAYDVGVSHSSRTPNQRISVIAIDDQSISNLGRWPWPRNIHAELIDTLRAGGAKVVGNLIFYSEAQIDPGLEYIEKLRAIYAASGVVIPALARQLDEARKALNTDTILAASLGKAGNVVLSMNFELGEPQGNPDAPLPQFITRNAVDQVVRGADEDEPVQPRSARAAQTPPIAQIGEQALAIGHLTESLDPDGGSRREVLMLRYYDQYFPSVALLLAAKSLNLGPADISVTLGEGVRLGGLNIATDPRLQMNTFFYSGDGDKPAFAVDSFYDVYSGLIPAEKYRDKIVLIGGSAKGVGDFLKTPVDGSMAPVQVLAHAVSSILNEDFFVVPEWSSQARLGVWLLVSLYLIVLFPHLRAGIATAVTGALFVALLVTHYLLMTREALWVPLMIPAALLLFGHALLATKRFLMTERGKLASEADSADSNRMLGLAFQGQGQLDMAFEKFRKCPLDDSMMDLLYNLGLDYERKRQFNKAGAAYQYMSDHDTKFRDIAQRMSRNKIMEGTVLLGASGTGAATGTLLLDGEGVQKPMLGRYQVEKELGKGAMGTVYLGQDPKINRVVAIKTMELAQNFEDDEVDEVKERFFREAETAGRLNHPNIVTIFDVGEEHDLAYIAMEFLKGQDLTKYTKPDRLLPVDKVLKIAVQAAEALDYAHGENVVHRDIKPANIMYEVDSESVKLTDFGIARITDSSRTKTGMVLGTPSYMSPEQLSGRKVDGRSDLFSLGVMLFQLCTGQLPFKADSMAGLMYKIANDAHPSPMELRPDLPPCLTSILDKALAKLADDRYSRGAEMARNLRACADLSTA
jgi:CHASE2 domain-containing sensor protein/tRNA A-37 threonylcarbamoyl transferase component Bud32